MAEGKSAVVTGGTRGIGLGITRSLAKDGYRYFVLGYSTNDEAAEKTKQELEREYGAKVFTVKGDVAVPETLQSMFKVVEEDLDNKLTAFVHNAGLYVGVTTPKTEAAPEDATDFESAYLYYHRVYPLAFKRGVELAKKCDGLRRIVAITSPGCNFSSVPRVGYEFPGSGKSSMEFLVRLFAKNVGKDVTVNAVCPGLTKTEAWLKVFEMRERGREYSEEIVQKSLNKRWIEPEEIGGVVAFLCSEKGSLITGMTINADGGLHLVD